MVFCFTFIANKAWLDRRFSISAIDYISQVFGSRLYQQLKDEPGNIIMSPFSVSGVMAMVRLIVVMAGYGKFDHQHIFIMSVANLIINISLWLATGGCWGWRRNTLPGATRHVIPKVCRSTAFL